MDRKIQSLGPDYRRIYSDILNKKFPDKICECEKLMGKKNLSVFDILELNEKIFGVSDKETEIFDKKHRAYKEDVIKEILNYQIKNKYSNTELARHFKLSRHTIAKWKLIYYSESSDIIRTD